MTMGTPRHPVPARFGGEKGPEGVAHHRQFAGVGGIEGFFHGARMGAMRDALGMRGQGTHFDALSCFVVTGHVVEHFVGVQIGVVVRNLDGFLMEIQRAGQKEQITKLWASKVWWVGGGMWCLPTIGLKSSILKAYG